MRIRGKKLTALLLAVCIVLGLAACGSGGGEKQDTEQISGTVYVPAFMDLALDVDYISGSCCDGKNAYLSADSYTEEEVTDPETGETYTDYQARSGIYRVDLESGEVAELENYEPSYSFASYDEGWFNLDGIRSGADGTIWVSEQAALYEYDLPEGFDEETESKYDYRTVSTDVQLMRQLDSTGSELQRIDISGLQEQLGADSWINSTIVDAEGDIFVFAYGAEGEQIIVLDKDMKVLFSMDVDVYGELITLSDGSVAAYRRNADGNLTLAVIDKAAKDWGSEYPMTAASSSDIYSGAGDYLFYYNNGESLYGYQAETQEGVRLLSWSDADINMDRLLFFTFLDDGRVAAMTQDWGEEGQTVELAVLEEKDASVLADKTTLTYATMGLGSDERAGIIKFNKTNGKYRIEIKDYSEFSTEEDYTAGLTKLNTEILAGAVPDIFDTTNLPLQQYGVKGLIEDLWPFIDNDPDIGRDTLMERVFTAAEQDGKLYQIFEDFGIRTVIGSREVVGDDLGWTLEELQAALDTMPEGCAIFGEGDTKSGMLQTVLMLNLDAYVDWEAGTCSFDSDNFKAALEFCNTFPLEYDWESVNWEERESENERIASGKQMLQEMNLRRFSDIQIYEAMFGGEKALKTIRMQYDYSSSSNGYTVVTGEGESAFGTSIDMNVSNRLIPGRYITYKGYPTEDGGCGSSFTIDSGLAMSSTCKDKDGAWSYMREMLLPREQRQFSSYGWGFPSNKADFDAEAAESMKAEYVTGSDGKQLLDQDGSPIQESKGGWSWDSLNIDVQATTQEEYDQIMELYNAIDSVYRYDTSIYEIINEQAGAYFSGDKSLDETAAQIQNRVNLYINENK